MATEPEEKTEALASQKSTTPKITKGKNSFQNLPKILTKNATKIEDRKPSLIVIHCLPEYQKFFAEEFATKLVEKSDKAFCAHFVIDPFNVVKTAELDCVVPNTPSIDGVAIHIMLVGSNGLCYKDWNVDGECVNKLDLLAQTCVLIQKSFPEIELRWLNETEVVRAGVDVTQRGYVFSDVLRSGFQLPLDTQFAKTFPLNSLLDLVRRMS